jgi:flagellin
VASITINSNISALTAQRRLGESTLRLQSSFSRLSSGLRINRASDDAAGLAIASALSIDKRVFAQGGRNLNDGISAAAIADSSIESLSTIVVRLQELAEQSANGTIGHRQRASLDAEAQALSKEYFRIARSAKFNEQLLDGSLGELRLQGGYGERAALVGGFGGVMGTGGFEMASAFATGNSPRCVTLGDLNGDGVLDLVTVDYSGHTSSVMLGNGDGSFSARASFTTGLQPSSVTLGDLNGDGVLDLVTADRGSNQVSVFLATTQTGTAPLLPFSLATMADARQALPVFKQKLDQLSYQRAEIGVFQSRMIVAVNNLQVAAENFAAAASQITDADVAEESAHLIKNQILQQAGAAILAQANAEPELALRLLGGL